MGSGWGRGGRRGSHSAAVVRMGWRGPCEWSELLCLYEELSKPEVDHHLTEVEIGPPRRECTIFSRVHLHRNIATHANPKSHENGVKQRGHCMEVGLGYDTFACFRSGLGIGGEVRRPLLM